MDHASHLSAHMDKSRSTWETMSANHAHSSLDQIDIKMAADKTDVHITKSILEKVTAKSAHHMRSHLTGSIPRESMRSTKVCNMEPPTTRKLTVVKKVETSSSI